MDSGLEEKVTSCVTCQNHPNPWEWPGRPWSRVHVDYAGPFMGKIFIDARSKWMDIYCVNSATSSTSATLEKLRTTFAYQRL